MSHWYFLGLCLLIHSTKNTCCFTYKLLGCLSNFTLFLSVWVSLLVTVGLSLKLSLDAMFTNNRNYCTPFPTLLFSIIGSTQPTFKSLLIWMQCSNVAFMFVWAPMCTYENSGISQKLLLKRCFIPWKSGTHLAL